MRNERKGGSTKSLRVFSGTIPIICACKPEYSPRYVWELQEKGESSMVGRRRKQRMKRKGGTNPSFEMIDRKVELTVAPVWEDCRRVLSLSRGYTAVPGDVKTERRNERKEGLEEKGETEEEERVKEMINTANRRGNDSHQQRLSDCERLLRRLCDYNSAESRRHDVIVRGFV